MSAATDAIGLYVFSAAGANRQCLPEIATSAVGLLAMTRQGNAVVHQRPPAIEYSPTRRSGNAAADAIGQYVFIDTLYELQVPSRDCHGREAPSQ